MYRHVIDFYDRLAPLYHLVYEDWEAAADRQAACLDAVLRSRWPGYKSVLDVSCGIGTQAIGLTMRGFTVTASDLSSKAVTRAADEARTRNLAIALSVCDMREAYAHHGDGFDLVISCDNSVPHLLSDEDIRLALKQMYACLRPGGGVLLTVRDYEREPRGTNILKPHGVRVSNGRRLIAMQIRDFDGPHYDLTMYLIEEHLANGEVATRAMRTRYYAIAIPQLVALMKDVGFQTVQRLDDVFYQPVLVGTKPSRADHAVSSHTGGGS